MPDPFRHWDADALMVPATKAVALTASGTDLDAPTRGLHVNADGNITVVMADDAAADTVTLSVVAGMTYPYRIRRLTAGTGVVGLF